MEKVSRMLFNICSKDLEKSRDFYTTLFDLKPAFESNWFINLVSEGSSMELGIIARDHELVPENWRGKPDGSYLTIVVDNLEEIKEKCPRAGGEMVAEPEDTFYGQRRMLVKDPDGTLIDISAPIPGFTFGE